VRTDPAALAVDAPKRAASVRTVLVQTLAVVAGIGAFLALWIVIFAAIGLASGPTGCGGG
jgi:hypothetical protein